jgi:ketosteroid isomerase-like protein
MRPEDAEALIREAMDAWNTNDWDAMERLNAPDLQIDPPEGWPEGGVLKGWPAAKEQYERLKDSWSEERLELREFDARDDEAFVLFQWTGHGKASGIDLDMPMYVIYEIRDGQIARQRFFMDEANAREAWSA